MIIQSCNHGEFSLIAYESRDLTRRQPCLIINSVIHRQHVRQLLEILLNKLQIECRIHETLCGSNSVFELQDGQQRGLAAASGDLSSQLSCQPGMGARTVKISMNKPSTISKMFLC